MTEPHPTRPGRRWLVPALAGVFTFGLVTPWLAGVVTDYLRQEPGTRADTADVVSMFVGVLGLLTGVGALVVAVVQVRQARRGATAVAAIPDPATTTPPSAATAPGPVPAPGITQTVVSTGAGSPAIGVVNGRVVHHPSGPPPPVPPAAGADRPTAPESPVDQP
ncbi:hypothetical protein [Micromonospora echinofusca]|uniref:Uncharacterized protein n=1 Tax=Micromonospora echinofusca TaxID=47858 RepID=A0ABS3VJY9_MICEH|nr:hypothetical protein [Micromonospora echinofusca]MBO4204835.1 hypothetical protein [Micromonospora echinofusca]